jgi:hypothetical protein
VNSGHSRFIRDVFKFPVSFIQVESVVFLVRRKENIRFAIVIKVTYGHSAAVIKIPVPEDVEIFCIHYLIDKADARFRRREPMKQGIGFYGLLVGVTGNHSHGDKKNDGGRSSMKHGTIRLIKKEQPPKLLPL